MHEAYDTLRILVGASAATTLMHGYVDSASSGPTSAPQAQGTTANSAPATSNASTQTSSPPPPKKPRKKSVAKKLQRLNGAIARLQVQAAASAEPAFKADEEAEEGEITETTAAPLAVEHLEAATIDTNAQAPPRATALPDTPSATKRSPSRTEPSPNGTPSRKHTGKKQRAHNPHSQPPQHQWKRTLVPATPLLNPPPPVALLAQNFARRAIHSSEWYWLAENEFEHTYSQCVHWISVELLQHNGDLWPRVCSATGPSIVREQMALDGVATVFE